MEDEIRKELQLRILDIFTKLNDDNLNLDEKRTRAVERRTESTVIFAQFTSDLDFLEDRDTITLIVNKCTRKKNNDSYED